MMSCVLRSYSVHDCFFLPEECLGYGLVVPFPAYGFAALVSHNESLNSLNSLKADALSTLFTPHARPFVRRPPSMCQKATSRHTRARVKATVNPGENGWGG